MIINQPINQSPHHQPPAGLIPEAALFHSLKSSKVMTYFTIKNAAYLREQISSGESGHMEAAPTKERAVSMVNSNDTITLYFSKVLHT